MNSEVIAAPEPFPEYPCLMESTVTKGLVVLFFEPAQGTVVKTGNSNYKLGSNQRDFMMKCFRPFTGKLVLSN